MKKIALLALMLILGMSLCVAQSRRNPNSNRQPQRERTIRQENPRRHFDPVYPSYQRNPRAHFNPVYPNYQWNPRAHFNPVYPRTPYWPSQIRFRPFKHSYLNGNSIGFYTSTNLLMGVTLEGQVLLAVDGNVLYIVNIATGNIIRHRLHRGYSNTLEIQTASGWRLVRVSYDGTCRVNYLTPNGNVLESYVLF